MHVSLGNPFHTAPEQHRRRLFRDPFDMECPPGHVSTTKARVCPTTNTAPTRGPVNTHSQAGQWGRFRTAWERIRVRFGYLLRFSAQHPVVVYHRFMLRCTIQANGTPRSERALNLACARGAGTLCTGTYSDDLPIRAVELLATCGAPPRSWALMLVSFK